MYVYVTTYQDMQFKYVQFILCQLYLNKTFFLRMQPFKIQPKYCTGQSSMTVGETLGCVCVCVCACTSRGVDWGMILINIPPILPVGFPTLPARA